MESRKATKKSLHTRRERKPQQQVNWPPHLEEALLLPRVGEDSGRHGPCSRHPDRHWVQQSGAKRRRMAADNQGGECPRTLLSWSDQNQAQVVGPEDGHQEEDGQHCQGQKSFISPNCDDKADIATTRGPGFVA
nr:PREDICTED: uncharacterized protein LOC106705634 [Latimeria chalumnae]|eukprot:XP_014350910.1 PREDICTED: uncharacterized protein LOC106705634 [Latimeria chalumnae]